MFISKNDKKTWHDYIDNFEHITLHLKKDNLKKWTVVGPVCESSDFLAKNASLDINEDDLIAVKNVGAYGFVMASNYNSRPKACEILIDGDKSKIIRQRETLDDLIEKDNMKND